MVKNNVIQSLEVVEMKQSQYSEKIVQMISKYNSEWEVLDDLDKSLAKYFLNHRLSKKAVTEIKDKASVIVEIGSFGGRLLEQLAKHYANIYQNSIVVGVDKGDYTHGPLSAEFSLIELKDLFEAEESICKKILNHNENDYSNAKVYRHTRQKNTFAVYRALPEKVFLENASLDLVMFRFMLGYLGDSPEKSLNYLSNLILPTAQRIIMLDYIGKCVFTDIEIPAPETVAKAAATLPFIDIEKAQNHFVLYARKS